MEDRKDTMVVRYLCLDRMIGQDSDVEHKSRCVRIDMLSNFNT